MTLAPYDRKPLVRTTYGEALAKEEAYVQLARDTAIAALQGLHDLHHTAVSDMAEALAFAASRGQLLQALGLDASRLAQIERTTDLYQNLVGQTLGRTGAHVLDILEHVPQYDLREMSVLEQIAASISFR
jgi:hypothetical protein